MVGNILVTTRDIKATEIILEEHPAALGCEILGFFLLFQCWTEGRRSTAVAEDLRPTATVAEVSGHSYGRRSYW